MTRAIATALHRRLVADESGFTLIELMVAVLVMTIGVIAVLTSFDSSRTLATSAEIRSTATAQAEREIERVKSQPWAQEALNSSPGNPLGSTPADPRYYVSSGPCDSSVNLPVHSPCYQWDWNNTANVEPLLVCTLPTDPGCTQTGIDNPWDSWSSVVSASDSSVRLSGRIYRFITWVNDPNCSASSCGGTNAYKRITVAITVNGLAKPIWLSTVDQNPAGGGKNPLTSGSTKCFDSNNNQIPCVN